MVLFTKRRESRRHEGWVKATWIAVSGDGWKWTNYWQRRRRHVSDQYGSSRLKDADTMTTTPNTEAITLQAIEDQAVEHISMVNEDQEEANKSAPWGIT